MSASSRKLKNKNDVAKGWTIPKDIQISLRWPFITLAWEVGRVHYEIMRK